MRIGLVCPYSLTVPGGVQGQVLALARCLRSLGHHVRVLGPCDGPPPDAGVTPLGASLPASTNGSVAPIAPDVSAQLRMIRALRDEEFDVVHVHEPFCPGPTQTTVLFQNGPLVATYHASGALLYRYVKPIIQWAARNIDVSCAVSEDARNDAAPYIETEFHLLWNGVEVEAFRDGPVWPTEGPTILFVGRHEPRKGLDVLLGAMRHLPPDVRLWIAGDGPDTDRLRQEFAGDRRIDWLGRISDDEKARRLRGADAFCAPSIGGESFGIVLLEGMAAGTPVVAADIPGYSAVAGDGRYAALFPPGDEGALADAVLGVISDPDGEAEVLRKAGAERADEYSMARLAERYVGLYRDAIVARARRR